MGNVYHIADLHLGHNNILVFSEDYRMFDDIDEHDEWIVSQWNSVVNRKDKVFVHGDVCMDIKKLPLFDRMKGNKTLIMGNHDNFKSEEYLKYFSRLEGLVKYKGTWLSHAPLHPEELRGCKNIHGHLHEDTIKDTRYSCVSVEQNNGVPERFSDLF